jgi:hypothetical protein
MSSSKSAKSTCTHLLNLDKKTWTCPWLMDIAMPHAQGAQPQPPDNIHYFYFCSLVHRLELSNIILRTHSTISQDFVRTISDTQNSRRHHIYAFNVSFKCTLVLLAHANKKYLQHYKTYHANHHSTSLNQIHYQKYLRQPYSLLLNISLTNYSPTNTPNK